MRALGGPFAAGRAVRMCAVAFAGSAVGLAVPAAGVAGGPRARVAKTVYISEHGRLKFSSEHGSTLVERGTAYGTYTASMIVDLDIHSKSVSASVVLYPRGGTIRGTADATYRIVKNLGYFGGNFNLGRGTGRYSHISEVDRKPLGISGVINRYNFEVEVKANGDAAGL